MSWQEVFRPAARVAPTPLGRSTTALEHRPELVRGLGVDLFLKREDHIDDLGCGHKLRKLRYVLTQALAENADVLVTAGSVPSNQCLALVVAAARAGRRAHLLYGGDEQAIPVRPPPTYLLTMLFGPTVTWRERSPWSSIRLELEAICERERARGHHPYLIPPGASAWPGILGSIELGIELARQSQDAGIRVDVVVAPAGSGGTCLGLHLAAVLLGLSWRVIGVCIGSSALSAHDGEMSLRAEIAERTLERELFDAGQGEPRSTIEYYDGALGDGYDKPTVAELEAMREVAIRSGVLFDPNYMIKAFTGMCTLIRSGAIPAGSRTVLVHTGGQLGLFGNAPALQEWYVRDRVDGCRVADET